MTYITFKENPDEDFTCNSIYFFKLIWIRYLKRGNLTYLHTDFSYKSKYYDVIFQYDKLFEKCDVNIKNLNKINISKYFDFDLNDNSTLLIADEKAINLFFENKPQFIERYENQINYILYKDINNIKSFLINDIDYDINSINITLDIKTKKFIINDKNLDITKIRYLSNKYYVNILNKLKNLNFDNLKINIVSDGKMSDFENDFKDFDINYILGDNTEELKRKKISYLINNDILIVDSDSPGVSSICIKYSTGLIICSKEVDFIDDIIYKKLAIDNMHYSDILNKIKKKNLIIYVDAKNIGHSFYDHQFACFSYYLNNIHLIDKVIIYVDKFSTTNKIDINSVRNFFNKNLLLEGKFRIDINISISMLFFMFEKNIIVTDKVNNIINPVIFERAYLRNVNLSNNFIDVYKKFRYNFEKFLKNKKNERYDITLLYRENKNSNDIKHDLRPYPQGGRLINNIEKFTDVCKENKIKYKIFNISKFYNFEEIATLFNSSDNIVTFHGCELTFGFVMKKNTTIIELTKKGHVENWWNMMGKSFSEYGLNYHRLPLELDESSNLNFDDNNIIDILKLSSIDLLK